LITYATTALDLNEVVPSASVEPESVSCELATVTAEGDPVILPTGTPTATGVDSITIQVGLETTCTFHDSKKAKLNVIKHVVNDHGGTKAASDFQISVTGTNPSPAIFPGEESPGTLVTLEAGDYSVDETELDGYSKTFDGDCSGTISAGDEKTCTITNDDIAPTLTLVKQVVNDNGGTATASQWTLSCAGDDNKWASVFEPTRIHLHPLGIE
jgi:hypothetical protein